jgi:Ca-activated chloride channel family protein
LVDELAAERSATLGRVKWIAEMCGLALVVVALLGPARGFTRRTMQRRSLDLVVCVDTSRSMLAEDLRPNRLTRARREVSGLLDQLAGDRVGLLAFSGDVREVAPLTRDRQTLKALLGELTPEENRRGGTNLGAALSRALDIFDGRTGAHEAIVVLTDGEDLEGQGAAMAERAREAGIGIFVVGIGTEAGGKIPIVDARGKVSFLKGPEGKEVVSKLDRKSLGQLAETTGGAFLTTSDSATPLEEMYMKRISKLSTRAEATGEEKVPNDRYQWALLPGFLLLLVAYALGERRLRRTLRRAPMRLAGLLFVGVWLVPAARADAVELAVPPASLRNVLKAAIEAVDDGKAQLALGSLTLAIGDLPAIEATAPPGATAPEAAAEPVALEDEEEAEPDADSRWSELELAELHFARGVVAHGMGELQFAAADFSRAAVLSGGGELRRDATYDAGSALLAFAEAKRAEAQAPPAPPAPSPPGAASPQPQEDPIEAQRRRYREARAAFVQGLRLDPTDEDTRADLELIVRRLRELDDQEEQQKQDQDQEKQDQDKQDQDQQDQQDQDQQDQQSQDQQDQDKSGQDEQDQQKQDQDQQDQEEQKESDKEREPQETPEPKPEEEKRDEAEPQEAQPKEAQPVGELSKEELARLIDQLQEMEAEQQELERRLRKVGRVPVKRDW